MTSASASLPFSPSANLLERPAPPNMNRRILIVASVVTFHAFALWALQAGFLRHEVERVMPAEVVVELIELPQPQIAPAPEPVPPPPPTPVPVSQPKPRPKLSPTPVPEPVMEPAPEPTLNTPAADDPPPTLAPPSAAPAEALPAKPPAPPAPPAPPKIELPSSHASYLNNAPPRYPALSKRLGEQGRVVVRALIDPNGTASQATVKTSSGYERLDQTAVQTVLKWRYVPGKRAGVPEAMWFNIPLDFVLE